MIRGLGIFGLSLGLLSSTAVAADLSQNESYQTGNVFEGIYLGQGAGYSNFKNDGLDTGVANISGHSWRGYAGYNYALGNIIIGPEIGGMLDYHTRESRGRDGTMFYRKLHNRTLYGGLRAGYTFENAMPYITAGMGRTLTKYERTGNNNSDGAWNRHVYYGAGLEYALHEHILTRFEIRNMRGDIDEGVIGAHEGDINNLNVSVGFAVKF